MANDLTTRNNYGAVSSPSSGFSAPTVSSGRSRSLLPEVDDSGWYYGPLRPGDRYVSKADIRRRDEALRHNNLVRFSKLGAGAPTSTTSPTALPPTKTTTLRLKGF
jgi:hypothetical protein